MFGREDFDHLVRCVVCVARSGAAFDCRKLTYWAADFQRIPIDTFHQSGLRQESQHQAGRAAVWEKPMVAVTSLLEETDPFATVQSQFS